MLKKESPAQTPAFNALTQGMQKNSNSTPAINQRLPFNYKDVDYIISIDGGGSSTVLQVMNSNLEVLELEYNGAIATSISGDTTNISIVGIDAAMHTLRTLLTNVKIGQERLTIQDLPSKALIAGIAGLIANADKIPQIQAMLNSFGLNNANIYLAADIELLKQLIDEQGAVIISGTGSICFSKSNNLEKRIGGLGYILGDEGSAFHLGKLALQKACAAKFEGENPFVLTNAICQLLEVESIEKVIRPIYDFVLKPADIAKIAPMVLDAAFSSHEQSCREIVDEYVSALAELVRRAVQDSTVTNFPIYLWGGLFESKYADDLIKMITKQVNYQYGLEFINIADANVAALVLAKDSNPLHRLSFPAKKVSEQPAFVVKEAVKNTHAPIAAPTTVVPLLRDFDYKAVDYIITIYEGAFNTVLQVVNCDLEAFELEYNGVASNVIHTGNTNMNVVGLPAVVDTLDTLLANVKVGLEKLSIKDLANKAIICGLAGLSVNLDSRNQIKETFTKFGFSNEYVCLASDVEVLKQLINEEGAVLASSTGSICFSRSSGFEKKIGGLGYLLGDEGSGYYIGKLALQEALAAKYESKNPFILTNQICTLFNVESIDKVIKPVCDRVIKASDIAKLAPMVVDAAFNQQDQQCLAIIDKCVGELARLVKRAVKDSNQPNFAIYLWGSVFANERAATLINMLAQKVEYQPGLEFINVARENILTYALNKPQVKKSPKLGYKG